MKQKCSQKNCPAPKGLCAVHVSNEYPKCEHWGGGAEELTGAKKEKAKKSAKSTPWNGTPFQPSDIEIISQRSSPLIIGMVGSADAGKTSYLGMLYTLLFNGKKFKNWQFAGSYTLSGWETLAQYLKIKPHGKVEFAPPTPSNPDFYSLYHLALKTEDSFRDILFADSSGEVFNSWSEDVNDPNAENARWIYKNSCAFIFTVDCMALIEKRGAAKNQIVQMAEQLSANLNGRSLAIAWTKADRIDEVKKTIKNSLEEDLGRIFPDSQIFEVSNFSKSDPDTLCHKNNLAVVEYLLEQISQPKTIDLTTHASASNDLFFDYRGSYVGK